MNWDKSGDYAIKSGNFTIAKCIVGSIPKYVLWLGKEHCGVFESADEARKAAAIRDREELAGSA